MNRFHAPGVHALICATTLAAGAGCRRSPAPAAGPAAPAAGETAPSTIAAGGGGGASPPSSSAASWPMPNPASAGLPNPQTFDTGTAGVVVDKITGLEWQQTANMSGLYWPAAKAYCADLSLAGHDDWRLPSLIELVSIVDFTRTDPAIDIGAFANAVQGTTWTSNPVLASPSEAWYVSFSNGFTYQGHEDYLAIGVRCVRAGKPRSSSAGYAFPDANTVADQSTGLVWVRKVDAVTRSWTDAGQFCRGLGLSGGGWRVPSMKELQTLLDLNRQIPALDVTAFPDSPTEQYWTSSPLSGSTTDAWYVSFRSGDTNTTGRTSLCWVRCVR